MEWISRLQFEALARASWPWFVTLTYADDCLPSPDEAAQEVAKLPRAIRKRGHKIRYFIARELGSSTFRLHHHAILWIQGYSPALPKVDRKGNRFTDSCPLFAACWARGFFNVQPVRHGGGLRYVGKYVAKQTKPDDKFGAGVESTGYQWSKRPMLGAEGLERWKSAVRHQHRLRPFGPQRRIPAYYFGNVLNKPTNIHVPYRDQARMYEELGVATEHTDYSHFIDGFPSGPIDEERGREALRLARYNYKLTEFGKWLGEENAKA